MKKIYQVFYILVFLFISNIGFAQITVVDAVAVDGNSNGFYGTVEIEFSTGVVDSEFSSSALPKDDWDFSLDPEFNTVLRPNNFYTDVSIIANEDSIDDRFVRVTFPSEFGSSTGPIYIRYTNGNIGTDDIHDTTGTFILDDFSLFIAPDKAPPEIKEVTSNASGVDTLIVGESIIFTVDFKDTLPDPQITMLPLKYNGQNLNWFTDNAGDTYKGIYTVVEGDTNRVVPLQLQNVTAQDQYGNVSVSVANSTDVQKAIDANTPTIVSVISDAITPDTLIVGDSIIFTVDINNADPDPDPDLIIAPLQYNGENLNWTPISGGDTYQGVYKVKDGNLDRVIPLQLTGVTATDLAGNISNSSESANVNVTIDANEPLINSVTSNATGSDTLIVGEEIIFTIDIDVADGMLSFIPVNYNGQSLNWYTNDGGSTYIGTYHVTETNQNRWPAEELINVQATDPAGNKSNTLSSSNVTKSIDANSPDISLVELKNMSKKIGETDTLYITINADPDDTNYKFISGTVAGYNISSIETVNSTTVYAFFTIEERTYDIDSAETVQVSNLHLSDDAGNTSNIITQVIPNDSHAIFSKKPVAYIDGDVWVCDGDSAIAPVFLSGRPPFTIIYTDNDLLTDTIDSIGSTFYPINAVDNSSNSLINFNITKVSDATGNNASGTGTFILNINDLPNTIIDFPSEGDDIDISEDSLILSGTPVGGIFSGNGVISSSKEFRPSIAGIGSHSIYYNYTDPNGCSNADTISVTVIEGGKITFSPNKSIFCSYEDTIWIYGSNELDTIGVFTFDTPLALDSLGADTAIIDISKLTKGNHTLTYTYGGIEINKTFKIDSIEIDFTGLKSKYCEDDEEVNLTGVSDGYGAGVGVFSGYGINANGLFTPSIAILGVDTVTYNDTITYTFTRDDSGCQKSMESITNVYKIPNVGFTLDKICIEGSQEFVSFNSTSTASFYDYIDEWDWHVNNTVSIDEDTLENPQLLLTSQANNSIELKVTTDKGCSSQLDSLMLIGSKVDLDFTWDKECDGDTVSFTVLEYTDTAGVNRIQWDFGESIGDLEYIDTINMHNPRCVYSEAGIYPVIYKEYTKVCSEISDTLNITIRPSKNFSSGYYFEDFEIVSDTVGWAFDELESKSDSISAWQLGTPNGTLINLGAGGSNNAYVTNLGGNYSNNVISVLSSPCFDLSTLERPMISFEFISALQKDRDGVIVQYSSEVGTWINLGSNDKGVNWYNTTSNYAAGDFGQAIAWTGDGVDKDIENVEWRNAKYWLEDVIGKKGVRFRLVLGADDDGVNEGFGFDNVWIGDRNRTVLVEHFTNNKNDDGFLSRQDDIVDIIEENSKDAILMQYFTSFPESNDFSEFYTAGPSARSLFYGVAYVPYSFVDGGDRKFDYSSENSLESSNIKNRMLERSIFDVQVKQNVDDNKLVVSATIKALENNSDLKLSARIAVVESIEYLEDTIIHNVLRAMLPDPAGILYERDWVENDSVNIYRLWDIPDGVNSDSLKTIVFIQDEDNNEIYQAGYANSFTTSLSTSISDEIVIDESLYSVYPNPMSSHFTVRFAKVQNEDIVINLYNNVGVLVRVQKLEQGTNMIDISTDDLPIGIYYVQVQSNDFISSKKIIKSN